MDIDIVDEDPDTPEVLGLALLLVLEGTVVGVVVVVVRGGIARDEATGDKVEGECNTGRSTPTLPPPPLVEEMEVERGSGEVMKEVPAERGEGSSEAPDEILRLRLPPLVPPPPPPPPMPGPVLLEVHKNDGRTWGRERAGGVPLLSIATPPAPMPASLMRRGTPPPPTEPTPPLAVLIVVVVSTVVAVEDDSEPPGRRGREDVEEKEDLEVPGGTDSPTSG